MRIANITVKNYKIFREEHSIDFNSNLIYLVGDNNTGKSTLFEAVNFVKAGLPKEKKISDIKSKFANDSEHVVCTIKFVGRIKQIIKDFSEAKYEKYVFDERGVETLIIQRSSEERFITQSNKEIKLDIKKVTIWNPESKQYENPSGIDAVIGTLFEAQFVWADSDPADVADFSSTKICGRLLSEAIGDFFQGNKWKKFVETHQDTFHGEGDSLSKRTKSVEDNIKSILETQYGKASIKFDFSLPDVSTFYKAGDILVDEVGDSTKLEYKGTGMQRAVALSIIQVYAQSMAYHPDDPGKSKPLFFFIDEPETCLHPKAQQNLLKALIEISKVRQIFVSTHSPYFLKGFNDESHDLVIFNRDNKNIKVTPSKLLNLFKWSPSWSEINYKAYNLSTIEFHNELYGALHEKYISSAVDEADAEKRSRIKKFDLEILAQKDSKKQTMDWLELRKGKQEPSYLVTPSTFIRNNAHHPESMQVGSYSEQDLLNSIQFMLSLLQSKP